VVGRLGRTIVTQSGAPGDGDDVISHLLRPLILAFDGLVTSLLFQRRRHVACFHAHEPRVLDLLAA
jgi:hypothetical protein